MFVTTQSEINGILIAESEGRCDQILKHIDELISATRATDILNT